LKKIKNNVNKENDVNKDIIDKNYLSEHNKFNKENNSEFFNELIEELNKGKFNNNNLNKKHSLRSEYSYNNKEFTNNNYQNNVTYMDKINYINKRINNNLNKNVTLNKNNDKSDNDKIDNINKIKDIKHKQIQLKREN